MPLTSIEIKFKVIDLLYADAYGETYRVLLGKKIPSGQLLQPESSKSKLDISHDSDSRKQLYEYTEQTYILKVVLQSKFNRAERQHILKKATQLISNADTPNVGKLVKLFRSQHSFFMVYKEPQWVPCPIPDYNSEDYDHEHELKLKLNQKLEVNLAEDSVDEPLKFSVGQPALNLFDFLIQRDK
jgi:hypothetical protein